MATPALTIELPSQREQTAFNLKRWEELLADPDLAKIEGRVECDRHGHIIMSPPPSTNHGRFQFLIGKLLDGLMGRGTILTECPISTADGVRAADVAWASTERIKDSGNQACFSTAPEICAEVISPRNSQSELNEKKALYFDAGAREVWFCSESGAMTFFLAENPGAGQASRLCPDFPSHVDLNPS